MNLVIQTYTTLDGPSALATLQVSGLPESRVFVVRCLLLPSDRSSSSSSSGQSLADYQDRELVEVASVPQLTELPFTPAAVGDLYLTDSVAVICPTLSRLQSLLEVVTKQVAECAEDQQTLLGFSLGTSFAVIDVPGSTDNVYWGD